MAAKDWLMASIVHGVVLDFSVPFWIAIFCPAGQSQFFKTGIIYER